jgi:hypothetical protein
MPRPPPARPGRRPSARDDAHRRAWGDSSCGRVSLRARILDEMRRLLGMLLCTFSHVIIRMRQRAELFGGT